MSAVPYEYGFEVDQGSDNKSIWLMCDDDPRSLEANLLVLAKNSKYFEAIVPVDGEIAFDSKNVSFSALEKIVSFLETGVLKPTMNDMEELLSAADHLQVDTALALLMEYLHQDVEIEMINFKDISKDRLVVYLRPFDIRRRYQMKTNYQHKTMMLKYVQDGRSLDGQFYICTFLPLVYHFNRIWNEPEVLYLDFNHIKEILHSDFLMISEEDVLRIVKMWVNFDLDERGIFFEQLLRCVRPGLSPRQIVEELRCRCQKGLKCTCLTSPDYAISLLAYCADNTIKEKNGPLKWNNRTRLGVAQQNS